MKKLKDLNLHELEKELISAARNGHLYKIQYILTSSELKQKPDINTIIDKKDSALSEACWNGNLEIVKYLLSSPELKKHADIHCPGELPLSYACYKGHFDIVKYLLTSSDLKEYANINGKDEVTVLEEACVSSNIDIVKYLMESNDLQDHPNNFSIEEGFLASCSIGNFKLINYFIFNVGIEKTDTITDFFENEDFIEKEKINQLFEKRELNKLLAVELENTNIISKRVKL